MERETILAKVYLCIQRDGEDKNGFGKSCPIDELVKCTGQKKVPLLAILRTSPRFIISKRKRVAVVPLLPLQHPIHDESKQGLLEFLATHCADNLLSSDALLAQLILTLTTSEGGGDGGESRPQSYESLLADIVYYEYASMDNHGRLAWNHGRIKDLATSLGLTVVGEDVVNDAAPAHAQTTNTTTSESVATTSRTASLTSSSLASNSPQDDNEESTTTNEWTSSKAWNMPDGTRCIFVDTPELLHETIQSNPVLQGKAQQPEFVALDCEGVPKSLELVQIGHARAMHIFDGRTLGADVLGQAVAPLLTSSSVTKVIHDLHQDALALAHHGRVHLANVLDTQLLAELRFKDFNAGFNKFLGHMQVPLHPSKEFVKGEMGSASGGGYWTTRPLPKTKLEYAALDVYHMNLAIQKIPTVLSGDQLELLKRASLARAQNSVSNEGSRAICFDTSQQYCMASAELLRFTREPDGIFGRVLEVKTEAQDVIDVLPTAFRAKFVHDQTQEQQAQSVLDVGRLSDIVIDTGRQPQCWIKDERFFLCDDETVVQDGDLLGIVNQLGKIGHDNRAGLDRKLHRFSVMRARDTTITGLTIRIGRSITGAADLLMDCLLGSDKSILFLGEPGSGKTTIVREATRILAEKKNVVIVDTSNEIGGDGRTPHKCIGLARRMMVKSLEDQSKVMIECVQNHTPRAMVIDEIGRPQEVEAARTVRNRGVRIIASAHGDLRSLIKNKELNGLVGGLETVTMGDSLAREEAKRKSKQRDGGGPPVVNKTKTQRRGTPTFDIVVELRRGMFHEWRVVGNVGVAVDDILDGREYKAELRIRDPTTGSMFLKYTRA